MRGLRRALILLQLMALPIAALLAGCSTAQPVPTERQGLLERIAEADHSRQTNRFARVSRFPSGKIPLGDNARAAIEVQVGQLQWPLKNVEVTSNYGKRGSDFHEGIDLRARVGTPVYAAQEGTVIYAGSKIRGYGRLIVIRHFRDISTVYAHNSKLLVRTGQYVRLGQKIAISGNTGRSRGPHLHFEIRDGMAALNPLEIMPHVMIAQAGEPKVESVSLPTGPLADDQASTADQLKQSQAAPKASTAKIIRVRKARLARKHHHARRKKGKMIASAPKPNSEVEVKTQ